MRSPARAVKTINALKYFIPPLIPLGANSCFEMRKDTGYDDYRLVMVEKAHTLKKAVFAGLPPTVKNIKSWDAIKKLADIPQ